MHKQFRERIKQDLPNGHTLLTIQPLDELTAVFFYNSLLINRLLWKSFVQLHKSVVRVAHDSNCVSFEVSYVLDLEVLVDFPKSCVIIF